jgi:hypothetical protein
MPQDLPRLEQRLWRYRTSSLGEGAGADWLISQDPLRISTWWQTYLKANNNLFQMILHPRRSVYTFLRYHLPSPHHHLLPSHCHILGTPWPIFSSQVVSWSTQSRLSVGPAIMLEAPTVHQIWTLSPPTTFKPSPAHISLDAIYAATNLTLWPAPF